MKQEDLLSLWEAHKQHVEQHDLWSEAQLAALLPTSTPSPTRWALRPKRVLLQLSLVLLSFAFSGC